MKQNTLATNTKEDTTPVNSAFSDTWGGLVLFVVVLYFVVFSADCCSQALTVCNTTELFF